MNRKLFLASVITLTGALPSFAQLPSIALSLKEPFDRRLKIARTKLEHGQYLDNVIKLLESCIKEKPDRFDLHLDLACANAGRAHVLAKSQIDTMIRERKIIKFKEDLSDWENSQKNQESILYNSPAPISPEIVRTKDDNILFSIPLDEVTRKIENYAKHALAEIATAEKFLATDSEEDKVHFYYVSAWIQAVLWRFPRSLTENIFPKDLKVEKIIKIIEKLNDFESSIPQSKLIISDFIYYINDYRDFQSYNVGLKKKLIYNSNPELNEKSIRFFREYLELTKNISSVSALKLSIFDQDNRMLKHFQKIEGNKNSDPNILEETAVILASDLSVYENIAKENSNNAILWYCYATKLLSNRKPKDSWDAIVKGNKMQAGGFLEYSLSAPKSLAWAVPTQVLIPKDFEILMSSISPNVSDINKNKQQQIESFQTIVKCIEQIETASTNSNSENTSKNKLLNASYWIKSTIINQLFSFSEKNPDEVFPNDIVTFLQRNVVLCSRVVKSITTYRRLTGETQNIQKGKK